MTGWTLFFTVLGVMQAARTLFWIIDKVEGNG